MSASRESMSPFVMVKLAIRFRRWPTRWDYGRTLHPRNLISRMWWEDTLGPLACFVLGHREYNAGLTDEPEPACHRCHRYLFP